MYTMNTKRKNINLYWVTGFLAAVTMGFISLAGVQPVNAQQTVAVEPDDYPMEIGSLNKAIEEHGGDVIYLLENGATYFVDEAIRFEHPLHFQAADYPENLDNPPIVRPGVGETGTASLMYNEGSTKSYNIFWFGMDDLGDYRPNIRPYGENATHIFKDCVISGTGNFMIRAEADGMTMRFEDCVLYNAGRHTSFNNQTVFDTRGANFDSLIFINNSIYQHNAQMFNSRESFINYLEFNHNTFANQGSNRFIRIGYAHEFIFTNNLLHNINMQGRWEYVDVAGDDGVRYLGPDYVIAHQGSGILDTRLYEDAYDPENPDALTDEDRIFVIRNNNFGGLPHDMILDMWENEFSNPDNYPDKLGEDPDAPSNLWVTDVRWRWANPGINSTDHPEQWAARDTVMRIRIRQPAMDSTLAAWAANGAPQMTYENNIDERVEFTDPPDVESFRDWLVEHWWEGTYTLNNFDRHEQLWEHGDPFHPDYRSFHPAPGKPHEPEDVTTAWIRDLSYSSDEPSFTHGEGNYPLGNLNYYPEIKEQWLTGEELTNIYDEPEIISEFRLVGNYPNPFNPVTNIVYELASQAEVNLEVFNVLGQSVATMELGAQNPGRHEVTFDASNLSSGLYIVRMKMGSEVQTLNMTLIK